MIRKLLPFTALLAGVMLIAGARAGQTSGLEPGAEVPTIHIDAFNDDRGTFCVTCEAGKKPALVAFVKANDESTRDLMTAVDDAFKANQEKRLYAGIVILGSGEAANALKQHAAAFSVPTAVAPTVTDEIKKWKLSDAAASTVFYITGHKVHTAVADGAADDVADHVAAIVG